MVASMIAADYSRKHSISSDLGAGIMEKLHSIHIASASICYLPDRSFSVLSRLPPHQVREWDITLDSAHHTIPKSLGKSQRNKPCLRRTHAGGIEGKIYRQATDFIELNTEWPEWFIKPPIATGCFRAPVVLSLLSSDAPPLRKAQDKLNTSWEDTNTGR